VTRTFLYRRPPGALAAFALAALALASAAAAAEPSPGGTQAPEPVPPAPASGVVSVEGPVTITARAGTLLGRVARVRGVVRPGDAGRRVIVQRFDDAIARWRAVARSVVGPQGGFVAAWRADRSGRLRIRAVLRPRAVTQARRGARRRAAAVSSAELGVTVYRPEPATWYGPGFFGRQTACGIALREDTVGVAHPSLPCGTQVALLYGGRTLVVPVIDRGPFNGTARWDLTQAAAQALGMTASATVGAVPLD
jgi:hypothetical protein